MNGPDGLLVACPSCSGWPMAVRGSTVGDESGFGFKCVRCGHTEGPQDHANPRTNSAPAPFGGRDQPR